MALNVQWRWAMPQVGNPDQVAQGNRDAFSEGIGAIAQGLLKRGENQREAQRLAQTQANWDAQFAAQQEQRKLANEMQNRQFAAQQEQRQLQNAMQNRQFWEQKRMNDQALANQQQVLQKSQEQQQWMQKFYDEFFGNDDEYQELKKLRAKFGNQTSQLPQETSDSALIMMGLNPLLR